MIKHPKPHRRYFIGQSEVTREQARQIRLIGGRVVTERNDEYIWRNWR